MPNVNDQLDGLRAHALGDRVPCETFPADDPDGERVVLRYGDVRIIDRGSSVDVALFLVTETRRGDGDELEPPAGTPFSDAIADATGSSVADAVDKLAVALGIETAADILVAGLAAATTPAEVAALLANAGISV